MHCLLFRTARFLLAALFSFSAVSLFGANTSAVWGPNTGNWSATNLWSTRPVVPDNTANQLFDATIDAYLDQVTLDSSRTVQNFTLTNGTLTGSSAATLHVMQTATLNTGVLGGSWNLAVDGDIVFNGGRLSLPVLNVAPTATMHINGIQFDFTGAINNYGTTYLRSRLSSYNNAGSFTNYGTLIVTSNTAVTSAVFNNVGLVRVPSGTSLGWGVDGIRTYGVGVSTGTCQVETGGSLSIGVGGDLSAATFTGGGNVSFGSNGTNTLGHFEISGTTMVAGTVNFEGAGPVSFGTLQLNAGVAQGSADAHVTSSLAWLGGGLAGSGTTYVDAGATLTPVSGGFSTRYLNRTLVNNGAMSWGNGYVTGTGTIVNNSTIDVTAQSMSTVAVLPSINNTSNGRINIATDTLSFSGPTTFTNAGVVTLTGAGLNAGSGVSSFTNSGRLDITAGSAARLTTGTFTNTETGVITVTGSSLVLGDENPYYAPGGAWSNRGTIVATDAVLTLGGQFTAADLAKIQHFGSTSLILMGTLDNTGHTLHLAAPYLLNSGKIAGGTLLVDAGTSFNARGLITSTTVIAGELTIGAPVWSLEVQGDFSLLSTARIVFTLRGNTQGYGYDALFSTGASRVTLGGTLVVELDPAFQISDPRDTYTLLTSAQPLVGDFDNVASGQRIGVAGSPASFLVTRTDQSVVLSDYRSVPEPSSALLALLGVALVGRRPVRSIQSR